MNQFPVSQFPPCPNCRQAAAEKVNFTWWGGIIGPRLLNHVKCRACGATYNGKTGVDNKKNIAIYYAVAIPVFIILLLIVVPAVVLGALYLINNLR